MRGLHSRFSYLSLRSLAILLLTVSGINAQEIVTVGQDDQILVGVQVFNQDQTFTAISDKDGLVTLSSTLNAGDTLTFRYLSYDTYQLPLSELTSSGFKVRLELSKLFIDEVVVFGRREVPKSEIPYQIATIKAADIASTHAQTSADALSQHAGVYVQKSQMGGGSPLIRGFEANRVLLVVDGVRLNNAIYRSGHLQSAITVDQAILEKMDVIFGPNSLMYGSDALGGVVHFMTRSPKLSLDGVDTQVEYYSRYASANDEKSLHADITFAGKRIGSLTSVTYADFGDLRMGSNRDNRFPDFGKRVIYQSRLDGEDIAVANENPNLQIGTGYNQLDVTQKFLYVPSLKHRFKANIHYSTSTDIPRYDNLSELRSDGTLRWAEWYYGPQKRLLASLDYRYLASNIIWDDITVIGAYQRIDEDRIERFWQSEARTNQEEDVSVWSLTADASKWLNKAKKLRLQYGLDVQLNDAQSTAFNEDVISSVITPYELTRYASDTNNYNSLGAYLSLNGSSYAKRLKYNLGMRYSHNSFLLRYDERDPVDWPAAFYDGIEGNNDAITWSVGATWLGTKGWNIRSVLSTAFRAPNIDDLSKVRVNSDEITFPNVTLTPERSLNAELTVGRAWSNGLDVSITGFYTRLSDAIVRKNGFGPTGETRWVSRGDTLQIVANVNADRARIMGVSANATYQLDPRLTITGSLNYTDGIEILDDNSSAPLGHIPPMYGNLGVKYDALPWSANIVYRFNGFKALEDYGGTVDNPELASPIGSLSWSTLNLYGSYELSSAVTLSLAVENLMDVHYRPFASGVSAPGCNVIASIRGRF